MSISAAHRHAGKTQAGKTQPATRQAAPRDRRVEEAFASARRHSGRVRLLKLALPAAALLMVAAFVGKSWLAVPEMGEIDLGSLAIENGRLVMSDPRLEGVTGSNDRPYRMTAARAIQDIGTGARIDLEGIDATLPVDDEGWMTVTASTGVFDREANRLDIDSELTLTTDNGVRAVLKSATVDIGAGSLDTADPVDISLEGARISADSMTVRDKGAVLIFQNRVRMDIEGGRLTGARGNEGEAQ